MSTRTLLALAGLVSLTPALPAQTIYTWNSASSGNWTDAANWVGNTAPVSGAGAVVVFGGTTSYTATQNFSSSPFDLTGLRFANSGNVTIDGSPATNAIQFLNANSLLPTLSASGSGNVTISTPMTWAANTLVRNSGSGTLAFSGNQTFGLGTKSTFINDGTGTLTLPDAVTYGTTGTGTGLVLNLINNNTAANTFNIGNLAGLANVTFNIGGTGTVRFSGNTGGDLFSGSAVLNVRSGATFDFAGNPEDMGAISGAGTIISNTAIAALASGYYVFSGTFSGTGGNLRIGNNGHVLVISGTNTYTGTTTVDAGTLIISANAPNASAGALGNATSEVALGSTTPSGTANASLLQDTPGTTIGRNIRVRTNTSGTSNIFIGGLNTTGTVTYSGNVTMGSDSAAAKALNVVANTGGTVVFSGNLLRATGATGATDTLTKLGGGTVVLQGANTFSGETTIRGGALRLDYTANNASKLSSSASLTLAGGSLELLGNDSAATTQSVNGLVLGVASPTATTPSLGGNITVTSGNNQNATLNLGAITRNTGSVIDFRTVNTGTGVATITTTTANGSSGILGGYATFGRTDWARNNGSNVIEALPAASYTTTFASGNHTSLNANTTLGSSVTTNTLRFTNALDLAFTSATDTLTLETGGLLVAAGTGATSIGTATVRGNLASSGTELFVHQHGSGTLTIHSVIGGTNLVKTGDGTLSLTANNTYTGITYINGGRVIVNGPTSLGAATADVVINGGILQLTANMGTVNSANRTVTVGPAGAVFDFGFNQTFEGNGFNGTGTVTKTGTGIWSVGSNSSAFTGQILIEQGALRMTSAQLNSAAGIRVASGAAFIIEDNSAGTWSLAAGGRFVLNGTGISNGGALRQQRQGTGTNAFTTTINREVVLESDVRIVTNDPVGTISITGNVTGPGGLTKAGPGILELSARDNTYAGSTIVANGTLRIAGGNDRLPTSTSVTLGSGSDSGVLSLNGFTQEIAGLTTSGTGTGNRVVGGATSQSILTVNLASGTQTFGGVLGGTGANENNLGLVKTGAGTLVLTAANTYTGNTTIQAGELRAANTSGSATGSGTVTVAAGTLSGTGSVGAVAVQANGTIRGDSGTGTGTLTLTGNSTLAGNLATQLTVSGGSVTANSQLAVGSNVLNLVSSGGAFTITLLNDTDLVPNTSYSITLATSTTADRFHRNGTPWDSSSNAFVPGTDYVVLSGSGGWTYTGLSLVVDSSNNLVLTFTPVPEPGLVVGIGAAGLGLLGLLRRRRGDRAADGAVLSA